MLSLVVFAAEGEASEGGVLQLSGLDFVLAALLIAGLLRFLRRQPVARHEHDL